MGCYLKGCYRRCPLLMMQTRYRSFSFWHFSLKRNAKKHLTLIYHRVIGKIVGMALALKTLHLTNHRGKLFVREIVVERQPEQPVTQDFRDRTIPFFSAKSASNIRQVKGQIMEDRLDPRRLEVIDEVLPDFQRR